MNIELAPDLERRLEEAVASGRFASVGDAVAEGLALVLTLHEGQPDDPRTWADEDGELVDGVPAHIATALDMSAEDLRLGRLVDADVVLASMDAVIAKYDARRKPRAAG